MSLPTPCMNQVRYHGRRARGFDCLRYPPTRCAFRSLAVSRRSADSSSGRDWLRPRAALGRCPEPSSATQVYLPSDLCVPLYFSLSLSLSLSLSARVCVFALLSSIRVGGLSIKALNVSTIGRCRLPCNRRTAFRVGAFEGRSGRRPTLSVLICLAIVYGSVCHGAQAIPDCTQEE